MLNKIDIRKVRPSGVKGMVISIPISVGFKPEDIVQIQQTDNSTLIIKKIKIEIENQDNAFTLKEMI